jgi:hypothetical protein
MKRSTCHPRAPHAMLPYSGHAYRGTDGAGHGKRGDDTRNVAETNPAMGPMRFSSMRLAPSGATPLAPSNSPLSALEYGTQMLRDSYKNTHSYSHGGVCPLRAISPFMGLLRVVAERGGYSTPPKPHFRYREGGFFEDSGNFRSRKTGPPSILGQKRGLGSEELYPAGGPTAFLHPRGLISGEPRWT